MQGFRYGVEVYNLDVVITTRPQNYVFNFIDVDAVKFDPQGAHIMIDDIAVNEPVPEPTTMIAGALLLLPFGASVLRSLRKSRKV